MRTVKVEDTGDGIMLSGGETRIAEVPQIESLQFSLLRLPQPSTIRAMYGHNPTQSMGQPKRHVGDFTKTCVKRAKCDIGIHSFNLGKVR